MNTTSLFKNKIKKQASSNKIIALGFALAILVGSLLLMLPWSLKEGVKLNYIDALYTSTSAVCVTGLITVDPGNTFTFFGQFVLLLLIQGGGIGFTTVGAGIILAARKKINLRDRNVLRDSLSYDSGKGVVTLLKNVIFTTLTFELIGAILSFITFSRDFSFWKAVWVSIFHSVAAFNNSGFDILGNNFGSISAYTYDIPLNLVTMFLVFFGGIGFLVIKELREKKFKVKSYSMHTKVVLTMSFSLIFIGAILLKISEGANITWLGAFLNSVSARTAGFSTFDIANFKNASLLIMIVLMFIGASPGSTGGGIKTTTLFALIQGVKTSATNKECRTFKYSLPKDAFKRASITFFLSLSLVVIVSILMSIFEPHLAIRDIIFEVVSAFGTVGDSTGITRTLSIPSKIISILLMYAGRIGPFTIASLFYFSAGDRVKYPEGNITIG